MSRRILVTGANGFIGRHVLAAALRKPGTRIRLVRHHHMPPVDATESVEIVHADLSRPDSLSRLCKGIDAVVHCASLIEGDERALHEVNDAGTSALVADAQRHGVGRIVYVSTAAVYGRGPFREADTDDLLVRPASATSRSRAAAERHVLAAGGTVLRPHLVYGRGDRWVIPGLVTLIRHLGAPVACTSAHSAVEVGALAQAVVEAALSERDLAGVHHVNHPVPLTGSAVVSLAQDLLHTQEVPPLTPDEARQRAAGSPLLRHHLDMLVTDHWFRSDRIWRLLPCAPGPEPARLLPELLPWYRQLMD
ncbi:NAD-dependent epimerase/dehydratase family protein [Streptomyces sp. NPDC059862]|uniref:NAD-dependent epimerase/dehydratase family protein n=1 Tax=unclassified Streptomyces TaxID=2593676 RepID=UPI003624ED9E